MASVSPTILAQEVLPTQEGPGLMSLPLELHYQIASYLLYPDALALKHTNRHFYSFVYTGVELKVDWLIDRLSRKLECPQEKCEFGTDEAFCCGKFRKIMEKRRRHQECRPAERGCVVVEGASCHGGNSIWLVAKRRLGLLGKRQKSGFDLRGTSPILRFITYPPTLLLHDAFWAHFTTIMRYLYYIWFSLSDLFNCAIYKLVLRRILEVCIAKHLAGLADSNKFE
jgi:hypothetical protein